MDTSSPQAYLNSGGTLTNGQIPTLRADTGKETYLAPPVNQTIDASSLGNNSFNLNPAPTPTTNGVSANLGTAIPKAEDIINQGATATPAEQQQQTLLQKIASLIGGNKTKTTLQNEAEQANGVSQARSVFNDLNTQLEGLNNQATALQNEAQYTIPNQTQEMAAGKGITTGGLAPITASQLRQNQIKQGAIATQSLTVKSALFGAQGKLALAQDAADKAATAQYEKQQQEIDAYKAQLEAIMPTLSKQEKAQAAIVQAQHQDRQNKIDNAKEDKKSIIAMATAALKNNPDEPAAQYAAQQALAESNKEQPDLQKALGLVGQYQNDPQAIALQVAQIAQSRAQTAKVYSDMAISKEELKIKQATAAGNVVIDPTTGKQTSELKLQAKDSAKALLDKFNEGGATGAVGFGTGVSRFVTGLVGGTPIQDFTVQFDNLKSLLSLDNVKLLKGQGQVSDSERKLLADASTKLSLSQSREEFRKTLVEANIGFGTPQKVKLGNPKTGESAEVVVDADTLAKAKADGLTIQY